MSVIKHSYLTVSGRMRRYEFVSLTIKEKMVQSYSSVEYPVNQSRVPGPSLSSTRQYIQF